MTTDNRKPIPPILNAKMVRRDGSIVTISSIEPFSGQAYIIEAEGKYCATGYRFSTHASDYDLMSIYVEPKPWSVVLLESCERYLNGGKQSHYVELQVIADQARAAYDAERKK